MCAVPVGALKSTRTFHAAGNEDRGGAPSEAGPSRRNLEFNARPVALSKNNRHIFVTATSRPPLTRTR